MNTEKQNPEEQNPGAVNNPVDDRKNRREALIGVGKFAAYAAPFTLLALTNKAEAATGHGPPKGGGVSDQHAPPATGAKS